MGYAFGVASGISELLLAALAGAAGPMSPMQLEDAVQVQVLASGAALADIPADIPIAAPHRRVDLRAADATHLMTALVPMAREPSAPAPVKAVVQARPEPTAGRSPGFVDLSPGASIHDGSVRRAADGLFYVNAQVNGVPVRFLVDTGASIVVLTPADAERSGVMPEPEAFHHEAETAGGRTAMALVTLARLSAGATERQDIDAAVGSTGLGVSLLGQSWLSKLQSITITGDRMVLQ